MIRGALNWYRKRKRAVHISRKKYGYGPGYWYDPETGDTWAAKGRYDFTSVDSGSNPAEVLQMAHHVRSLEPLVEPEDIGVDPDDVDTRSMAEAVLDTVTGGNS